MELNEILKFKVDGFEFDTLGECISHFASRFVSAYVYDLDQDHIASLEQKVTGFLVDSFLKLENNDHAQFLCFIDEIVHLLRFYCFSIHSYVFRDYCTFLVKLKLEVLNYE